MKKIILIIFFFIFELSFGQTYEVEWLSTFGGSKNDKGLGLYVNKSGEILTCGSFNDTLIVGSDTMYNEGEGDGFFAKYDETGNILKTLNLQGLEASVITKISEDNNGNIIVSGSYKGSVDFDLKSGTHTLTSFGGNDGFIAKYDNNYDLSWVHTIGGSGDDQLFAFDINSSNEIVLTIGFQDTVTATGDSNQYISSGFRDFLVSKLDENGQTIWTKLLGSDAGDDYANGLKITKGGNINLVGKYQGTMDFDPDGGVANNTSYGVNDIMLLRLNNDGEYVWHNGFGGTGIEHGYGIDVDSKGNLYITGGFRSSSIQFDGITLNNTSTFYDGFISKIDTNGNVVWAKNIGGEHHDGAYDVSIDDFDDIFVTGTFRDSILFDTSITFEYSLDSSGIFVVKYASDGDYLWNYTASSIGLSEFGRAIILDKQDIYVTGYFKNTVDFSVNKDMSTVATSEGGEDYFILKINNSCYETQNKDICYGDLINGIQYFENSVIRETIFSGGDCDSITIDTFVTVIPQAITDSISYEECDSLMIGNSWFYSTGTHIDTLINNLGCDSTYTVHDFIINNCDTNSVHENISVYNYKLSPNPFNDMINIKVDSENKENLMISITDLTGKTIYKSTKCFTNQTIQLGEDLIDGMYLIRLVHGDQTKLIKAIKK